VTGTTSTRWILATLCLSLLVMRISGAHLHLCFDGSEPPLSYHVADSGIHHVGGPDHGNAHEHSREHSHEQSHDDRDLDVGQDLLLKKLAGKDVTLALIAFALLLFLLSRSPAVTRTAYHPPPPGRPRAYLRPPLRGPPSLA
jgi:hypothetical protein